MSKYTHYRKGAKVFAVDGDRLEYDGTPTNAKKGLYDDTAVSYNRGKKTIRCTARFYVNRGINKAKQYVRKNNLKSYNED